MVSDVKHSLLNQNDATIVETFLFGSNGLNEKGNTLVIESRSEYIIALERFIAPLL